MMRRVRRPGFDGTARAERLGRGGRAIRSTISYPADMPHEYDDPISTESLEAAVRLALELRADKPGVPLDEHVAAAVELTICGCATSIEDLIEGGMSGLHAAVLQEVEQRAARLIQADEAASAAVDEASAESFPASDPPAWIHRPR